MPTIQRNIDLRIWDCVCDSFLLNKPFTVEEAALVCQRTNRFQRQRAMTGSKEYVRNRVSEALTRLERESSDLNRLSDGRFILPSAD